MNLGNLKPTWRQFRLLNSMPNMDREEILFILERAESVTVTKTHGFLISTILFFVLTFCFQGG